MEENENHPYLLACIPLTSKFAHLKKIIITSGDFKIGRSLTNSVCIPHLSVSRYHCTFKKIRENEWCIEDHSTCGIKINDVILGKGSSKKLEHEDLISLEQADELYYKFVLPALDAFETPRKRMRMTDSQDSTIINNVKLKFEESQKCEIQHIEDKIQNAKQLQTKTIIHKKKLQDDMNKKIQQLENVFSVQIENLKGEKDEVERQKASLIEERDTQLAKVKEERECKISYLMDQISKQNESETELLNENTLLKEKLKKEREDFLSELNRESSSKQDMLNKLEAKIQEQEEVRLREKQELEDTLRQETELLRLAKEKELEEMAELKHQKEKELEQELNSIKQNLAKQVEQTEQLRIKAEKELNQQMVEMNKLQAVEKAKMEQLQKEREEILKKLTDAEKSKVEIQARVIERETELAALASERIQKQVDQSSEVISTLQEQLEKVKCQLQTVETEKNTLLENICMDEPKESTSKQATLNEFGELMESELQCSICAELFVEATTLNCSHTFCKYCIATWKNKKKDCPICRMPIKTECKSLVVDSFIEKMVENLTSEMKKKREDMLTYRAELEALPVLQPSNAAGSNRGSSEFNSAEETENFDENGENDSLHERSLYTAFWPHPFSQQYDSSSSDSGSDIASVSGESYRTTASVAAGTGTNSNAGTSTSFEPSVTVRDSDDEADSHRSRSDTNSGSNDPYSDEEVFDDATSLSGSVTGSDDATHESATDRSWPYVDRSDQFDWESIESSSNRSDDIPSESDTERISPDVDRFDVDDNHDDDSAPASPPEPSEPVSGSDEHTNCRQSPDIDRDSEYNDASNRSDRTTDEQSSDVGRTSDRSNRISSDIDSGWADAIDDIIPTGSSDAETDSDTGDSDASW